MRIFELLGKKYLSIALLLFCTYLFLKPSSGLPSTGINDKVGHCVIFISLFITWAFFSKQPKTTFLYFLAYGCVIEICQYLLPVRFNRGFELADILADTLGLLIAYVVYYLIKKRLK